MAIESSFRIGGAEVAPGQRLTLNLPVANLYTNQPVNLPVQVIRGREPGPTLFVSAALHGDEIIGVEIIRRVLRMRLLEELRGTLLAVPVVNVLAFLHQSRYLPDRRDLNRSFPGSESGSLAARLAYLFIKEVVGRSDYGIDLHTGAAHRPNLPQLRADLGNRETLRLAKAFGAPLVLNSEPTAGTLREYTTKKGIPVLLYESAEALRFDETCIRIGVQGVLNVLSELEMVPRSILSPPRIVEPVVARGSTWARSPASGILRAQVALGDQVQAGQLLGIVGDPFGQEDVPVYAPLDGVVIGRLHLPLVHEGDALFHIARVESPELAAQAVDRLRAEAAIWEGHEPRIV
ncbi:MAG: succinylglutamate desuccinylase/aspartoacylase family protein [Gammaproteobacteria bacterium]|nr:succinylglutamate desuccinylase/aspartoacylase family protein [Gammaproteobacteria bacterium]